MFIYSPPYIFIYFTNIVWRIRYWHTRPDSTKGSSVLSVWWTLRRDSLRSIARYKMVLGWGSWGPTHPHRKTPYLPVPLPLGIKRGGMDCQGMTMEGLDSDQTPGHFFYHQVQDTIVVLEEGNQPHTWITRCDMLVPWWTLNGSHPYTEMCTRRAERKGGRLVEEEAH